MGEDRNKPSLAPETLVKPEQLIGKEVAQHGHTGQQKVIITVS